MLDFDPATGGGRFRDRIGIVLQAGGHRAAAHRRGSAAPVRLVLHPLPRRPRAHRARRPHREVRRRIGTLSGGQLRRLDLALALVGRPEVVFLDEPTTGFDPEARRRSWDLIESLRDLGTTIVLTSHYMDEVERLADRVAVIAHGEMVALGPPADLGAGPKYVCVAFRLPAGVAPSDLPPLGGRARLEGGKVVVDTLAPTELLHELTGWAMTRWHRARAPQREPAQPRRRLPRADDPHERGGVRTARLIAGQIRHQARLVARNRLLLFFTFALPLLLFFMFQIVIHGDIFIDGQRYSVPQFFGPSLAGYGVVTGTYSYLAVSTTFSRQEGILKRLRGTPLPAWVYIAGRIGSALVIAAVTSGLLLTITVVFYDLHIALVAIPAIVLTFVVGAVAFGALGLAIAAFAPNGDAAVAIAKRDVASGRVRVVGLHPAREPVHLGAGRRLVAAAEAVFARVPTSRARGLACWWVRRGAGCSSSCCGGSPVWPSRCATSRGCRRSRALSAGRDGLRPSRRAPSRRSAPRVERTANGRPPARGDRGSDPNGRRRVR